MRKSFISLLIFMVGVIPSSAQQPATTAPLVGVNSRYVQGVGPGYQPTAGSGLTLNVAAGTSFCDGVITTYAGGTLSLTNAATNRVYLNTSCTVSFKTTAFVAADIPIATVVTSGGAITSVTDQRTWFVEPSGAGAGISDSVLYREHFIASGIGDGNGPSSGQWAGGLGQYGFSEDETDSPGIFFVAFTGSNRGAYWTAQNAFDVFDPALTANLTLRVRARAPTGSGKVGITTDALLTSGSGPTVGQIQNLTTAFATYEFTTAPAGGGVIFVGSWGTDPMVEIDFVEVVEPGAGGGTPTVSGVAPIAVTLNDEDYEVSCPTCGLDPTKVSVGGLVGGFFAGAGGFRAMFSTGSSAAFVQTVATPVAGWMKNPTFYISTNPIADGTMVTFSQLTTPFRTAATNYSVVGDRPFSVITGQTGNTGFGPPPGTAPMRLEAFQPYNVAMSQDFPTGSSVPNVRGFMTEFVTDNNTAIIGSVTNVAAVASSTTNYRPPTVNQDDAPVASEALAQVPVPAAYTARNFLVVTSGQQPASGSCTHTLRLDTGTGPVDTALVITVPASGFAGPYYNYTNTVTLAAGDLISIESTNNATAGGCALLWWAMELVPGTPGDFLIHGYGHTAVDSTTRYSGFFARSAGGATESSTTSAFPRNGTVGPCSVIQTSGTAGGTVTLTVRHNFGTGITTSFSTSTTNGRKDIAGTFAVLKNDTIALSASRSGAGSFDYLAGFSCLFR